MIGSFLSIENLSNIFDKQFPKLENNTVLLASIYLSNKNIDMSNNLQAIKKCYLSNVISLNVQ